MRIVVTGGAGFIGSHIVDQLVDGGHEVIVVDDLDPAAHQVAPATLNASATYHWADVCDPQLWPAVLGGVDVICHQAAKVGLGVDFADVGEYCRRNVTGTATLLRALHDRNFAGRIVLASSMVVYGEGRYRCAAHGVVRPAPRRVEDLDAGRFEPPCPMCAGPLDAEPVPEDQATDPRNVYAVTKLAQEGLVASYAREHRGSTAVALRYHNVYGPGMPRDTPYAGVASLFRSAYARGDVPKVFEDGGQLRDFVHVTDVARANVAAIAGDGAVTEAFNVCTGNPRSVLQMAEALRPPGAPAPQVVGGYRLGDVRHVFASAQRAAQVLGFRATIGFDDGMAEFVDAPLRPTAR